MPDDQTAPRFITVRSRALSLWQSAVLQATKPLEKSDPELAKTMRFAAGLHAEAAVEGQPIPTPPPPTPGQPLTLEQHMALSKGHFELVRARKRGDTLAATRAKSSIRYYSNKDYEHWVECGWYLSQWYVVEQKSAVYRDWTSQSDGLKYSLIPYQLPADAKILMIGDWGTGMSDAVAMLTDGVNAFKPDAIIHVGDIYYSGIPEECQEHVIDVINNLRHSTGLNLPFFTIPGNHEYYSGDKAFTTWSTASIPASPIASNKPAISACAARTMPGNSSPWTRATTTATR